MDLATGIAYRNFPATPHRQQVALSRLRVETDLDHGGELHTIHVALDLIASLERFESLGRVVRRELPDQRRYLFFVARIVE